MAKRRTIRFGAIGCGGAGTHRINQVAKHALGVEMVAAVDIVPARLDNLEKVLGTKFIRYETEDGYRRMIDEVELDAVGVFTPHLTHYVHAKYALDNGKHLLIEKPMVCGAGNAVEIAKLAAKKRVKSVLHYQRHYEPPFVKARELILDGVIGEVTGFYVYMAQDWSGHAWRGDPALSGGGQLNDSGSHYYDILLWMTGLLPKSAEGSADYYYHGEKKRVEINGMFNVVLSNGAAGRVIIVGDTVGGFTDDVRIRGSKGDLLIYGNRVVVRLNGQPQPQEFTPTLPKGYPESPCDNFVKLLYGKSKLNYVPLIFGARVALLTDAMLTAAATGKQVDCDELLQRAGHRLADLE